MKLTGKQINVLCDVIVTNDPWWGVRGKDGNAISGRRKTIGSLWRKDLITLSANWQIADPTPLGIKIAKESVI